MLLTLLACTPKGTDGWIVTLYGDVVDEAGAPVEGAQLTFTTLEGTPVGTASTDAEGTWHLPTFGTELLGNALTALVEAEGLASGWATWPVDLRAPVTTTLEAGPWETWQGTDRRLSTVRLGEDGAAGAVEGVLVDAVTAEPLAGVPLALLQGWNAPDATPPSATAETDEDGTFAFSMAPAGTYTVLATPDGRPKARFPVFLGVTPTTAVGVSSEAPGTDLLRASLTWGRLPADLDLHLSAPRSDGSAGADENGQYHVWSGRPNHPETDPEGVGPDATMERSDSDNTGPETIAIYRAPGEGSLYLSVFDNTNASADSTTELSESGAVLQVWYSDEDCRFYQVDPGEVGTLWNPIEIDTAANVLYSVATYRTGDSADDPDAFFQP